MRRPATTRREPNADSQQQSSTSSQAIGDSFQDRTEQVRLAMAQAQTQKTPRL